MKEHTPPLSYKQLCTASLFSLSLAHQEDFDRTASELREKMAAWDAEKKRLSDTLSRKWTGVKKVNRQLIELGCAAPDIISEEWAQSLQQQTDSKFGEGGTAKPQNN